MNGCVALLAVINSEWQSHATLEALLGSAKMAEH